MNRRAFLSLLAAAAVSDPERLPWTPGRKLISIPKAEPPFLLTPEQVARIVVASLERHMVFAHPVALYRPWASR